MAVTHGEFVSTRQGAQLIGMSLKALRRRVQRGDLSVFRDPCNDKVRLLRVADLEALRAAPPVEVGSALGQTRNPA